MQWRRPHLARLQHNIARAALCFEGTLHSIGAKRFDAARAGAHEEQFPRQDDCCAGSMRMPRTVQNFPHDAKALGIHVLRIEI
jgi:hypothetical protein